MGRKVVKLITTDKGYAALYEPKRKPKKKKKGKK